MSASPPGPEITNLKERIADLHVTILAGGVGGAKLVQGVAYHLKPENLTVIVNTGDDFQHLGLTICPDLDTVMYTLAGAADDERGWGRSGETWRTIEEVRRLGGPDWFALGDLDLATHLTRRHLLARGFTLTEVTRHLSQHFGLTVDLLPMCDLPAPTIVVCEDGEMDFQTWFVERQWQPVVKSIKLPNDARTTAEVVKALSNTDILIIAPSNPFVSIDPILNCYPVREMIADVPELSVAVSPIVGGKAIKGPAAKMMAELGMEVSSAAVGAYYNGLIDAFVYDSCDPALSDVEDLQTFQTNTVMQNLADRCRLAGEILSYSLELLES